MTTQEQTFDRNSADNHRDLHHDSGNIQDDSSVTDEEYIVPLDDHQPNEVHSSKQAKTTTDDRGNEKFVKSIQAYIAKIENRLEDLQNDIVALRLVTVKHMETKKTKKPTAKTGTKEPDRFCIDKLSQEFAQIHFSNRDPTSETDVAEVTSIVRNVYFDKKHSLIDNEHALEIVTPEELSIHRQAVAEDRPLFQITDAYIPSILKRIQRIEPKTIVKMVDKVGIPVFVDLPEIVRMEKGAIEMAFHNLKLASISSNMTIIGPSLMREIRNAFPLSKINTKPNLFFKSIYDLGHTNIYQEVKNNTLIEPIGIETIQVEGKHFVTDAAIRTRKTQIQQVEIEGKTLKAGSAIDRLFAEPIETSSESESLVDYPQTAADPAAV